MANNTVQWTKKYKGRKVVILPDGSEMDSKMLSKKYNLTYVTAVNRINEYIEDGHYKDLIRENRTKKKAKRKEIFKPRLSKTHYEDGDIRMLFDKHWKTIASAT